jgi:hypothetical protein
VPRLDDKIRVLITIFIRLNDQVSIKSASGSITATVAGKLEGARERRLSLRFSLRVEGAKVKIELPGEAGDGEVEM